MFLVNHSHYDKFTAVRKVSGKRMTAVKGAAGFRHLAPLFVIAAGVNVIEFWIKQLDKKAIVNDATGPHWKTIA